MIVQQKLYNRPNHKEKSKNKEIYGSKYLSMQLTRDTKFNQKIVWFFLQGVKLEEKKFDQVSFMSLEKFSPLSNLPVKQSAVHLKAVRQKANQLLARQSLIKTSKPPPPHPPQHAGDTSETSGVRRSQRVKERTSQRTLCVYRCCKTFRKVEDYVYCVIKRMLPYSRNHQSPLKLKVSEAEEQSKFTE